jgi:hypothetical protein
MKPAPEPVPLDEVAAVLTEAITRASGGPGRVIPAQGAHLAAALHQAGFMIVRHAEPRRQLNLWGD